VEHVLHADRDRRGHADGTVFRRIGAGISPLVGNGGGLYFLAFGALLLIANEVASAWSLIVGIGKDTGANDIVLVRQPTPEGPPAGQLAAEQDGSRAVPGR